MAWYDIFTGKNKLDEKISAFKGKDEEAKLTYSDWKKKSGEGIDDLLMYQQIGGYGATGLGTFNSFYNTYISKAYETEFQKILEYRRMAEYPEISDVIEDACNEMCSTDEDENVLSLDLTDKDVINNENISNILYKEFNTLFYDRIDMNDKLWDLLRTYFIDGRVYYERVIDTTSKSKGIIDIKRLPTETMDFEYDPKTGRILGYYQYLTPNYRRPINKESAEKDAQAGRLIMFEPAQIGFVNYGIYGETKLNILGYLEKAKVPYNQLKLLETSVVIYRLIRSPERLVFKIDTGAMPRDKSLKYVEKIKQSFIKKQSYNPQTGSLANEPEVFCIKHDTEIPLLDGRFLTLDELICEHKEGKENWVYTINQNTLNIEPGKIKNALLTRFNEKIVRVNIDDGSYIYCTSDHKFILKNGSECRADELKNGQSLMSLYIKTYKVVNVEFLNENSDCGCLEIDGNHNFAVSSNGKPLCFIRNSILENFFLPQCLKLNTKISLVDGRNLTLNQIIEEYNNGIKNQVYSIDQKTGQIIFDDIEWAGVTRKNAELIKIYLENDEFIECTPDHKFLVWTDDTKSDMIEVEAQNLTEEMDLVENV